MAGNGSISLIPRIGRVATLVTLLLAAAVPRTARSEVFTVAVLGDTQSYMYSEELAAGFAAQTQWVADNVAVENIKFVTQNGDIVEHGDVAQEWQWANAAMSTLDTVDVPWATNAGNHELNEPDDFATGFDTYLANFGPARHQGKSWFGGADAGGLNTYQTFSGNGRDYLHLSLEYDVPDASIAWAQGIIDQNPGTPTILTTHTYLRDSRPGAFGHGGPLLRTPSPYTSGTGRNSGEQIWDKLVRGNSQIFMTINGHYCCERKLTSTNDANLPVFQLQVDYSRSANGGDGWTRLLRFDEENGEIRAETYTPGVPLNPNPRFDTDADSQFTLPLDWGVRFDGEDPPTPEVPSGVRFQGGVDHGYGAYSGAVDTWMSSRSDLQGNTYNVDTKLSVLDGTSAGQPTQEQALLRFDNVFGDGPGMIPLGTEIESATLVLAGSGQQYADSTASHSLHRMLVPWQPGPWTNPQWGGDGIQTDGIEAAAAADDVTKAGLNATEAVQLDVTGTLQAWSAGQTNNGWVLKQAPGGEDRWFPASSNNGLPSLRPMLYVDVPEGTVPDPDPDPDPEPGTVRFQQGVDHGGGEYTGAFDIWIEKANPTYTYSTRTTLRSIESGTYSEQAVIRFNDVIGDGPGQIPPGVEIQSATLIITTDAALYGGTAATIGAYRVLKDWNQVYPDIPGHGDPFWGGDGIQNNGADARIAADDEVGPIADGEVVSFDVTAGLQAFADGAGNYGWALLDVDAGDDRWYIRSSDHDAPTSRPLLEVTFVELPDAAVVGRHVYYNGSAFGDAVATDKRALLPGETATFENLTGFDRGINGIVIDLADASNASAITLDDFEFSVGLGDDPDSWVSIPGGELAESIDVLPAAGVDQSDRIVLTLPDGLANTWLEVTVKATANTGLDEDDVFYFGNVVGETGGSDTNMLVNAADTIGVRDNPRGRWNPAGIGNPFDVNRDRAVDALDVVLVRNSATSPLGTPHLLNLSGSVTLTAAPVPEPSTLLLAWWGAAGIAGCCCRRRR